MPTKELQNKLKESGQSVEGQRNAFIKPYENYGSQVDQKEIGGSDAVGFNARDNFIMVMGDDSPSNKYMRTVPHKG